MLVAESRMVMGKAHVFHVGSLSKLSKIRFAASAIIASSDFAFFSVRRDIIAMTMGLRLGG